MARNPPIHRSPIIPNEYIQALQNVSYKIFLSLRLLCHMLSLPINVFANHFWKVKADIKLIQLFGIKIRTLPSVIYYLQNIRLRNYHLFFKNHSLSFSLHKKDQIVCQWWAHSHSCNLRKVKTIHNNTIHKEQLRIQ